MWETLVIIIGLVRVKVGGKATNRWLMSQSPFVLFLCVLPHTYPGELMQEQVQVDVQVQVQVQDQIQVEVQVQVEIQVQKQVQVEVQVQVQVQVQVKVQVQVQVQVTFSLYQGWQMVGDGIQGSGRTL